MTEPNVYAKSTVIPSLRCVQVCGLRTSRTSKEHFMLLLIIVVLLFGGGGGYYG